MLDENCAIEKYILEKKTENDSGNLWFKLPNGSPIIAVAKRFTDKIGHQIKSLDEFKSFLEVANGLMNAKKIAPAQLDLMIETNMTIMNWYDTYAFDVKALHQYDALNLKGRWG